MDTAPVNSVLSPAKLRSVTANIMPTSPNPHQSTPDFYQARNKPIPIAFAQRLPASSCIRNAPATRTFLVLQLPWPAHCRYNSDDCRYNSDDFRYNSDDFLSLSESNAERLIDALLNLQRFQTCGLDARLFGE